MKYTSQVEHLLCFGRIVYVDELLLSLLLVGRADCNAYGTDSVWNTGMTGEMCQCYETVGLHDNHR